MMSGSRASLTPRQIERFIEDGFVRIDGAFPADLAEACRNELWAAIGLSPDRPEEWTRPVIRVPSLSSPAFVRAANTPRLHRAYDQLAGPGRWCAPRGLGTFPIRFPSADAPGDDGWHVDTSFGESPDFMEWRVNVRSRGRALLMLFLFSDVSPDDAPTRIRVGSHAVIARELLPYGEGAQPAAALGRRLRNDGRLCRGAGHGRAGHGLPLPSLPGACGATASGNEAALHGATAPAAERRIRPRPAAIAGSDRDPTGLRAGVLTPARDVARPGARRINLSRPAEFHVYAPCMRCT